MQSALRHAQVALWSGVALACMLAGPLRAQPRDAAAPVQVDSSSSGSVAGGPQSGAGIGADADEAAPRPPLTDSIAARVAPCAGCHGEEGRATNVGYFPRIAGKPAGYLFNQLVNFRDGRRQHVLMAGLVAHLSDAYLHEMADYFAGLDLPYPPPQSVGAAPAVLARGAMLARQGDPAREIPACTQCHGERLTGVAPAIPGLLGLPRDYLNAQFGAWREGQRHAAAPDCMATVVERLAPADIEAVSTWLAAQPLPADTRPAPALAGELPLPCGGLEVGGAR